MNYRLPPARNRIAYSAVRLLIAASLSLAFVGCGNKGPTIGSLVGKSRPQVQAALGNPISTTESKRETKRAGKVTSVTIQSCTYETKVATYPVTVSYLGDEFVSLTLQIDFTKDQWKEALQAMGFTVDSAATVDANGLIAPLSQVGTYRAIWQPQDKSHNSPFHLTIAKASIQ